VGGVDSSLSSGKEIFHHDDRKFPKLKVVGVRLRPRPETVELEPLDEPLVLSGA